MADNDKTTQPGWLNPIQGNKRDVAGQAELAHAVSIGTIYESKEAASGIVSNVNIRTITGFTTMFDTVKIAYRVVIRTDAAITIRFNSATNDPITIAANTSFDCNFLEVTSIFVTAAGSAALKVLIA